SGVQVVVEGIGDHGLEYMTGGRVIVLGDVGKNFGQGMSGGVAYILPSDVEKFKEAHQLDSLDFDEIAVEAEKNVVKDMLEDHLLYTNSTKVTNILEHFESVVDQVVKVIPKDYKLMMENIEMQRRESTQQDAALLNGFSDKATHLVAAQELTAVY